MKRNYTIPYQKAVAQLKKLGITTQSEYFKALKSGLLPRDTWPGCPQTCVAWRHHWKGFAALLGKPPIDYSTYLPYAKAKQLVAKLNLSSRAEYIKARQSGLLDPTKVPYDPSRAYREFESWLKFLTPKLLSFTEAKALVRKLGITSEHDYICRFRAGELPTTLIPNPGLRYRSQGWQSWADFLGVAQVKLRRTTVLSYDEASDLCQTLGITTSTQYRQMVSAGTLPDGLPSSPSVYYRTGSHQHSKLWKGWTAFLTGIQAKRKPTQRSFLPFDEARALAHSMRFKCVSEYKGTRRSNSRMAHLLPACPDQTYSGQWISWPDFLGRL